MNYNELEQWYDGDDNETEPGALTFAVSGTLTDAYTIHDTLVGIAVDGNWTAATIGINVYNPVEDAYDPLYAADGTTLVTFSVANDKPVYIDPAITRGLKEVKFSKSTAQLTAASKIIITTARV